MKVIQYQQLPLWFDAAALSNELALLEQHNWHLHYQTKHYEGNWSALPLRSRDGSASDIYIAPGDHPQYHDTPLLDLCPAFRAVLASFHCRLNAVRLMKLDSGAVIREHTDAGLNFENGEIRLHIPVVTHPGVEFYLNGDRIVMSEGTCWYLNFNLPHRISNPSPVDRIHLVIDAAVNDWVTSLFASDTSLPHKMTDDNRSEPDEHTRIQMIRHLREMATPTSLRLADELEQSQ